MRGLVSRIAVAVIGVIVLGSSWTHAQITTGTITGSVQDQQGAVIPGATVVLISESRGTKSAPVMSNDSGDYVFPNVTPDGDDALTPSENGQYALLATAIMMPRLTGDELVRRMRERTPDLSLRGIRPCDASSQRCATMPLACGTSSTTWRTE